LFVGHPTTGFALSGEVLFFAPPKKSTQKKGGPEGLPANAGSLRFSPFRALAELAGFAAPCGLQIQLRQGGSLNPEMAAMLGCAGRVVTLKHIALVGIKI
jgi:hypothetical protein